MMIDSFMLLETYDEPIGSTVLQHYVKGAHCQRNPQFRLKQRMITV
jgi:hypothetical protein